MLVYVLLESTMLKKFKPFLGRENALTLSFFELLFQSENNDLLLIELQQKLDISKYKLTVTLTRAQEISSHFSEINLKIDKTHVTFSTISYATFNNLKSYIADQSIPFQIFIFNGILRRNTTEEQIQQKLNISSATYFRIRKRLFNDLNINCLDEMQIRFLIFDALTYFNYFDYLIDYNAADLAPFIALSEDIWDFKLPEDVYRSCAKLLMVNYIRSLTRGVKNVPAKYYLVNYETSKNIQKFTHRIMHKLNTSREFAIQSTNMLLIYVLYHGSLPIKNINHLNNAKEIQGITSLQLKTAREILGNQANIKEFNEFTHNLAAVNAAAILPIVPMQDSISDKTIMWHKESHPGIDYLSQQLTDILLSHSSQADDRVLDEKQCRYLFGIYISTTLPANIFEDTVYLSVNFTQSRLLTQHVLKECQSLTNLNIVAYEDIDDKIDIYISNTYNPNFDRPQVIWDNVPEVPDWLNLYKLIIKVKHEKFAIKKH